MTEIKLCKDCKHADLERGKCKEEHAKKIDYVMGRHRQYSLDVVRESSISTDCGSAAQWFEPKERA